MIQLFKPRPAVRILLCHYLILHRIDENYKWDLFFFGLFRATPKAYGGSQVRG